MVANPVRYSADFTMDGGARIQLQREVPARGLFGRSRLEVIPISEWMEADHEGRASWLLDGIEAGNASADGNSVVVVPAALAALAESEALAYGLPPSAPLIISLRGRGLITEPDFNIAMRWLRLDGGDVAASVKGARAAVSGNSYRLPQPLFGLLNAAQAVNNAADVAAKQAAFAELRTVMKGHDDVVDLDGVLREIRVAYGANFSLSIREDGGQTDFDPVLFAPRVGEAAAEGAVIDEDADNLLTGSQQADFAAAFRRAGGRRSSYLLSDGLLLFVDSGLRRTLEVVGQHQRATPAERRRFAASPRRAIAEHLGRADPLDPMFIETAQYSDRVTGIDPWRKPVLPWIKPKPNSWLPDSFGLSVGEPPVLIDIGAIDIDDVLTRVSAAMAAGVESIEVDHHEIPATTATIQALEALKPLAAFGERNAPSDPPGELADKLFLQVRDNLENVEYAPLVRAQASPAAPIAVPSDVVTVMKPHQLTGFRWLVDAWRSGRPGVLLADDMGLGKTLQALALLCWLRDSGKVRSPTLIVAPTGLLANWRAEIARHLKPGVLGSVVLAYGDGLQAMRTGPGTDIAKGAAGLNTGRLSRAGLVLTTYETLRDYHISMASVGFAVIVFDEAQRVKNPSAQVTRSAKTLRARFTLAVTGTPVENRLQDLWSICDTVHPGLLGASKSFEVQYGAGDAASLRDLNAKLTTAAAPWPAFMLRRMKSDHLEGLPDKLQIPLVRQMPPEQAAAYGAAIGRALAQRGSGEREAIIQTLSRLRAISLAPDLPSLGPGFASRSARLQAMLDALDQIHAKREKALIFCESLQLQPIIAGEIRRRYGLGHSVACISGQVPGDQRQRIVEQFQQRPSGFDVLILSPRAGGVGLTITAANHVIHLTRWWNPAVEDQATDRVFRIGQDKDVTVWIPISEHPDPSLAAGSFDHRLAELLQRKRTLAGGLLVEPESADDAQRLLDDVLSDFRSADSSEPNTEAGRAPLQLPTGGLDPSAPPVTKREPTASSAADNTVNARFVKPEGRSPPFDVFTVPMVGKDVRRIDIVDPYAAASRQNCRYFAEFISTLRASGVAPGTVNLLAWDDDSLANERIGSNSEQRRVLREAIAHFRLENMRILPDLVSRRQRPLHDRSVTAYFVDKSSIVWDLGRGIDGFMNPKTHCTIGRWLNLPHGIN